MNKETRLDRFEIDALGNIGIRFHKLVVDDEVATMIEYHRTMIDPITDATVMLDNVRDHLAYMKFPLAGEADLREKVKALVELFHTPEIIEACRKRIAEASDAP